MFSIGVESKGSVEPQPYIATATKEAIICLKKGFFRFVMIL
jgi:hypothetical protein